VTSPPARSPYGTSGARGARPSTDPGEPVMNEKQLAKLIKQNVAKAEKAAQKKSKTYDATLPDRHESEQDAETSQLFKEMKKREF
jgi:hypothetical protein